ncbi:MAG: hypothetical protein ACJ79U_12710, partial [Myxococcales bacterium]
MTFLRGGAADMFSAHCKAELLKAGYRPEWFGSYNHVRRKIKEGRDYCKKYDEAKAKGEKLPGPAPTDEQRYLEKCDSGHLTQDAVYRQSGGRGDPCSNVESAPGYSMTQAPCMPHAGNPDDPRDEHGLVSKHEQDSAAGPGGRKPGDPYPVNEIAADSDKRTKELLADKTSADRSGRKPVSPEGGKEGASAGASATSGDHAPATSGVADGKPSEPNESWKQELTGKTAADCINSFRKAAEDAMRQKCKQDAAANRARANGGEGKTEKEGEKHRAALQATADKSRAAAEADPDNEAKQKQAARDQARSSVAERAKCRADQGDYLNDGTQRPTPPDPPPYSGPPFHGIVPSNAT